jgi:hypothetical protein
MLGFLRGLFQWREVVSPTSKPRARGPLLVVCPRLFIQCIRSYPSLLEAVIVIIIIIILVVVVIIGC